MIVKRVYLIQDGVKTSIHKTLCGAQSKLNTIRDDRISKCNEELQFIECELSRPPFSVLEEANLQQKKILYLYRLEHLTGDDWESFLPEIVVHTLVD